jgi:hypothetical protein
MSEQATQIAAPVHEADETHHLVYRMVDGEDPDWASRYADWLVNPDPSQSERAVAANDGGSFSRL